jgi:hypothetical protein
MMTFAEILGSVLCAAGFYGAWVDYSKLGKKCQQRETAKAKANARPPKQKPSQLASYAALQRAQLDERAAASARLDTLLCAVREARTSDDQLEPEVSSI